MVSGSIVTVNDFSQIQVDIEAAYIKIGDVELGAEGLAHILFGNQ